MEVKNITGSVVPPRHKKAFERLDVTQCIYILLAFIKRGVNSVLTQIPYRTYPQAVQTSLPLVLTFI